jgi:hypothetical protein
MINRIHGSEAVVRLCRTSTWRTNYKLLFAKFQVGDLIVVAVSFKNLEKENIESSSGR